MIFLDEVDVMAEDGGGRVTRLEVGEELVIKLLNDRLHRTVKLHTDFGRVVNHLVIFALGLGQTHKMRLVHHNIGLAIAMLDDVDHQVVDNFRVGSTDAGTADVLASRDDLRSFRVLAVTSEVGDNVANTYKTALKRGRNDGDDVRLVDIAALDHTVEFLEGVHRCREVFVHFELTVVGDDAVEGIEREVVTENTVENTYRVDIVIEKSTYLGVVHFGEVSLARVTEGRVTDIVTERNRFNQVEVQIENLANRSRNTRHELYMKSAS